MKKLNRILVVICLLALTFATLTVSADEGYNKDLKSNLKVVCKNDSGSVAGAKMSIFLVADREGKYKFKLTKDFSESHIKIDCENQSQWDEVALGFFGYAVKNNIPAVSSAQTDESGIAVFDNLVPGLYLVSGCQKVIGNKKFTVSPFMVALPGYNDDGSLNTNVTATPKNITVDIEKKTFDKQVIIIWDDEGKEPYRPKKVSVNLFCDEMIYDTVDLTEENNWTHVWRDLEVDHQWVIYQETPEGYVVTTVGDNLIYTFTNTPSTPKNENTETEKLPQTGQLWWPVPVLAFLGIGFIIVGIVLKKRIYHE